jgi:hypothetical protein
MDFRQCEMRYGAAVNSDINQVMSGVTIYEGEKVVGTWSTPVVFRHVLV